MATAQADAPLSSTRAYGVAVGATMTSTKNVSEAVWQIHRTNCCGAYSVSSIRKLCVRRSTIVESYGASKIDLSDNESTITVDVEWKIIDWSARWSDTGIKRDVNRHKHIPTQLNWRNFMAQLFAIAFLAGLQIKMIGGRFFFFCRMKQLTLV